MVHWALGMSKSTALMGSWRMDARGAQHKFSVWNSCLALPCTGTHIVEDGNLRWEWALKFSTLRNWVGQNPTQSFKVGNLSAHSQLIISFSKICDPMPRECQARIPNRELVLSASGVHSPGPDRSCRPGHTQNGQRHLLNNAHTCTCGCATHVCIFCYITKSKISKTKRVRIFQCMSVCVAELLYCFWALKQTTIQQPKQTYVSSQWINI
jgi:hypothetical protein